MDGAVAIPIRPLAPALPAVGDPEGGARLAGLALALAERFALGTECTTAAPPAAGWDIDLALGAARVRLRLDEAGMAWAAPRFLDLAADQPVDEPLLAALFEAALADGFAELERLLDAPLRAEGLAAVAAGPGDAPPALGLVLTDGGVRLPLWIWTDDAARLPAVPRRFPAAGRLPLAFRVTAGGRELALGRLRAAAPGDILVTEQPYGGGPRPVTVWLGRELALGGYLEEEEDRLMIEQRLRRRNLPDDTGADDTGAEEETARPAPERLLSPHDLESLPVRVEVDIGTVELTLRELRELAPGTVLALGRPLDAPAILTVNGCRIGTADLVEVGGRLGARILTLVR